MAVDVVAAIRDRYNLAQRSPADMMRLAGDLMDAYIMLRATCVMYAAGEPPAEPEIKDTLIIANRVALGKRA